MPNTPRERVAWIIAGVLLLLLLWCAFGSYLNLPTFASLTAGTLESEEATPSAVKESASQVPAVQRPVSNTIAIIPTPTPKPSVAVVPSSVLPFAANLLAVAGDTSVTLSWSVPLSLNPVSHYVVSRSTSPAQGSLIATTPVPFY
ncbi:MAG: hypothetical protein HYS76_00850, partial [Candidatus Wildermuthbacteria bacterium]|nr:hypothetical protein [Candidatus Wildermuthbacteria bacterium]